MEAWGWTLHGAPATYPQAYPLCRWLISFWIPQIWNIQKIFKNKWWMDDEGFASESTLVHAWHTWDWKLYVISDRHVEIESFTMWIKIVGGWWCSIYDIWFHSDSPIFSVDRMSHFVGFTNAYTTRYMIITVNHIQEYPLKVLSSCICLSHFLIFSLHYGIMAICVYTCVIIAYIYIYIVFIIIRWAKHQPIQIQYIVAYIYIYIYTLYMCANTM